MIEYNMPREPAFKMSPKTKSIVSRIVALVLFPAWSNPVIGLVVMVLLGFTFIRTVAAYHSRRLAEKPHEKKSRAFFMCAWRLGWEVALWFVAILLFAFVASGGGIMMERFGNIGGAGIVILFVSSLPAVVRIGGILFQKSTNHSSSTEPSDICEDPEPNDICEDPEPSDICEDPEPSDICEAPEPNIPDAPAEAKGPKLIEKSTNHSSSTEPNDICEDPEPSDICEAPEPNDICEAPKPNIPDAPAEAKGPKLNMWHRLWIVASAVYFVLMLPIIVLMTRDSSKGDVGDWLGYVSDRELEWAGEIEKFDGFEWHWNGVVEITAPPEFPEYKIEAIKSDFEKARNTYIRNQKLKNGAVVTLLFWLGPVLLVYALGRGVAWIRAAAKV